MVNVLLICLSGFSFSARQYYETLLPKLLARAVVHESLCIDDALTWIRASWPRLILVTDAEITNHEPKSKELLEAIKHSTKVMGITTILMGYFADEASPECMTWIFQEQFELLWEPVTTLETEGTRYDGATPTTSDIRVGLGSPDPHLIRMDNLVATPFTPEAVYLRRVPLGEAVYSGAAEGQIVTCAAIGRTGLGKLGFVGDVNTGEEAERAILAMGALDRSDADVSRGRYRVSGRSSRSGWRSEGVVEDETAERLWEDVEEEEFQGFEDTLPMRIDSRRASVKEQWKARDQ